MKSFPASLLLAAALSAGFAAEPKSADYVVHEWGTFTSLQGADGGQLKWLPQIGADLPDFVYLDNKLNSIGAGYASLSVLSKSSRRARQRMETPVLYFYSDEPRKVDVEVRFPAGIITEWYPRVSHAGPAMGSIQAGNILPGRAAESFVRWDDVHILPAAQQVSFKNDGQESHYYPARETESNPLKIVTGTGTNKISETEKLLFYRGLGQFEAPLCVTLSGDEKHLNLAHTGDGELKDLFVLAVRQGQAKVTRVARVGKHTALAWQPAAGLKPAQEVAAELARDLETVLVGQGLYRAEAKAMIKTWRKSWFAEDGVRVLYSLPAKWIDRTLPLQLNPQPKEVVRVMIGRAELITPRTEWALLREIVRYTDETQRAAAVKSVDELRLGRLLEPVLANLMGANPTRAFRNACDGLRQAWTKTHLKEMRPFPLLTAQAR